MKRPGLLYLVSALVWGALAPLLRVALVSYDVLAPTELLTVTFRLGFFTLVLPLLLGGIAWTWLAPRLRRQGMPWWWIPGTAFVLSQVSLLVGGGGLSDSLSTEPFRVLWPVVVTGLALAAASALAAFALLPRKRSSLGA